MNYDRKGLNKTKRAMNEKVKDNCFPGRWIGRIFLIVGPIFSFFSCGSTSLSFSNGTNFRCGHRNKSYHYFVSWFICNWRVRL